MHYWTYTKSTNVISIYRNGFFSTPASIHTKLLLDNWYRVQYVLSILILSTFIWYSCRELVDPLGPQAHINPTEGAFGPLSHFRIGLLGESYKVNKKNMRGFLGSLGAFLENSKMIVWSRISICSYRHLNNWNPSIICHFITV